MLGDTSAEAGEIQLLVSSEQVQHYPHGQQQIRR